MMELFHYFALGNWEMKLANDTKQQIYLTVSRANFEEVFRCRGRVSGLARDRTFHLGCGGRSEIDMAIERRGTFASFGGVPLQELQQLFLPRLAKCKAIERERLLEIVQA